MSLPTFNKNHGEFIQHPTTDIAADSIRKRHTNKTFSDEVAVCMISAGEAE